MLAVAMIRIRTKVCEHKQGVRQGRLTNKSRNDFS
jgi:hypothetical protein